jgi:hypothetical protein
MKWALANEGNVPTGKMHAIQKIPNQYQIDIREIVEGYDANAHIFAR